MPQTPSDDDNTSPESPESGRYLGPETTDHISSLLAEYSEKLKAASQELDGRQYRQILAWFALALATFLYARFGEVIPTKTDSWLTLFAYLVVVGGGVCVVSGIERARQRILRSNLEVVANHLEKAVRTASQIEEHAERDMGRRLELDLRLAEAETLLRYVHHQTGWKEYRRSR